jgi:hypothetical protein
MNVKVIGVIVAVIAAVAASVGVRMLLKPSEAKIDESAWKVVDVPKLCSVSMPGDAKRATQNIAGMDFVMYTLSIGKDAEYAFGYSNSQLPPQRRSLPVEQLLNDACNGSVENTKAMGTVEVSRTSIALGEFPGKSLVMDVPKGSGQMLTRIYIAHGRLYMLLVGGKGYSESSRNAQRFFDSFKIIDTGPPPRKPTDKTVPPKSLTPPVAEPPKPPAKLTYDPPPLPALPEFTSKKISKPESISLPEPVQRAMLAGGGKYIVALLPKSNSLAIVDLDQRKIARTIPYGDVGPVMIAATARHVFLLDSKWRAITRYNLATGERDGIINGLVQNFVAVDSFTAGHSSDGPLGLGSIHFGMNFYAIDGSTPAFPSRRFERGKYYASATGRTFLGSVMTAKGTLLHEVAFRNGGVIEAKQSVPTTGLAIPGPGDDFYYAVGLGIAEAGFKEASRVPASMLTAKSPNPEHAFVPAASGDYFIQATALGKPGPAIGTVRVYRHGIDRPLQTLTDLPMAHVAEFKKPGMIPFEETVHLVPRGGFLAVIPIDRKEIKLYPVRLNPESGSE